MILAPSLFFDIDSLLLVSSVTVIHENVGVTFLQFGNYFLTVLQLHQ